MLRPGIHIARLASSLGQASAAFRCLTKFRSVGSPAQYEDFSVDEAKAYAAKKKKTLECEKLDEVCWGPSPAGPGTMQYFRPYQIQRSGEIIPGPQCSSAFEARPTIRCMVEKGKEPGVFEDGHPPRYKDFNDDGAKQYVSTYNKGSLRCKSLDEWCWSADPRDYGTYSDSFLREYTVTATEVQPGPCPRRTRQPPPPNTFDCSNDVLTKLKKSDNEIVMSPVGLKRLEEWAIAHPCQSISCKLAETQTERRFYFCPTADDSGGGDKDKDKNKWPKLTTANVLGAAGIAIGVLAAIAAVVSSRPEEIVA